MAHPDFVDQAGCSTTHYCNRSVQSFKALPWDVSKILDGIFPWNHYQVMFSCPIFSDVRKCGAPGMIYLLLNQSGFSKLCPALIMGGFGWAWVDSPVPAEMPRGTNTTWSLLLLPKLRWRKSLRWVRRSWREFLGLIFENGKSQAVQKWAIWKLCNLWWTWNVNLITYAIYIWFMIIIWCMIWWWINYIFQHCLFLRQIHTHWSDTTYAGGRIEAITRLLWDLLLQEGEQGRREKSFRRRRFVEGDVWRITAEFWLSLKVSKKSPIPSAYHSYILYYIILYLYYIILYYILYYILYIILYYIILYYI